MAFGEWWGLSKAFAKEHQQSIKDMAIAMRTSKADKKGWADFMKE